MNPALAVERRLANGMKVIVLSKPRSPVVAVQVLFGTGSAHEYNGIRGLSHILEHMMFRGSANVKSEEHARRINDVGGHSNAYTAEDMTGYLDSVPAGELDLVLTLEADRCANLIIQPEILETERKVIVEEYHTYMNNPVARAFLQFREQFFGDYPYALSPLGRIEDFEYITVEHCRA
jgi:zinc protease